MKFRSDEEGYITALRFYKQANNTGTTWATCGRAPASSSPRCSSRNETASGWQEETLPVPVAIAADTTYITSYHSSAGPLRVQPGGYFFGGIDRPPLHAPPTRWRPATASTGTGASGFPDQTFNATNYWVDAVFERARPVDTRRAARERPPRPARGRAGVARRATSRRRSTSRSSRRPSTPAHSRSRRRRRDGRRARSPTTARRGRPRSTRCSRCSSARRTRRPCRAAPPASPTSPATAWPPTRCGPSARRRQCPCTVFAPERRADRRRASQDQPVEVGHEVPLRRGRLHHRAALLQAGEQHRHARRATSGRAPASCSRRRPSRARRHRAGSRSSCPNPVADRKDTTYVTSYYSAAGDYAFEPGVLRRRPGPRPAARAQRDGLDGGNGVYHYGASGFPDQSFNATNYWVDATFDRTIPPDTRGPVVTELKPGGRRHRRRPRRTEVTAAFDEPLAPASVSGSTFTLRDEDGAARGRGRRPTTRRRAMAKLKPQPPLAYSETYTRAPQGRRRRRDRRRRQPASRPTRPGPSRPRRSRPA